MRESLEAVGNMLKTLILPQTDESPLKMYCLKKICKWTTNPVPQAHYGGFDDAEFEICTLAYA